MCLASSAPDLRLRGKEDYMGQEFYVCQTGTGGPITTDQKERLDSFIPCLETFRDWESSGFSFVSGSLWHMRTAFWWC